MKILTCLEKSKEFLFLLFTSFAFFILRLPSLFEPYWYGDEGIYQVIGLAINNGRLLYRDIWDNKPPVLYLIYAFFSSDQFSVRLFSLIIGILSIAAFCFLAKNLFLNRKITFATTAFFSFFFAIPLFEGNIANAENFMLLPIILSALLIFNSNNRPFTSHLSPLTFHLPISGFLLSIAFLTKIVAIFDLASFTLFLLIVNYQGIKHLKSQLIKLLPLFLSFIILPILVALFFLTNGGLNDFINAAFKQNIGYVGYGNQFLVKQGLLFIKLFTLGFFTLFVFLKREKFTKTEIFILIWLAFSLFNAFFSGRPYTHYLLVLLPSFSLLIGLIGLNKKFGKIYLILFVFLAFLLYKNFWLYKKIIPYYNNFILFITKERDVSEYRSFFDRQTPVDYQLSQYLKLHSSDKDDVFIWGNNGQVYKLLNKLPPGRYIVKYHITSNSDSLKETAEALKRTNPKYIIISSDKDIPFNISSYNQKFTINSSLIYERLY